jgi:hypothetical protein
LYEVFFDDLVDDAFGETDCMQSLTILFELFEIEVVLELDDFVEQFEKTQVKFVQSLT